MSYGIGSILTEERLDDKGWIELIKKADLQKKDHKMDTKKKAKKLWEIAGISYQEYSQKQTLQIQATTQNTEQILSEILRIAVFASSYDIKNKFIQSQNFKKTYRLGKRALSAGSPNIEIIF